MPTRVAPTGKLLIPLDPAAAHCPQCSYIVDNMGAHLDKRCNLHQRIADLEATIAAVVVALGGGSGDNPVELIKARMLGVPPP